MHNIIMTRLQTMILFTYPNNPRGQLNAFDDL